jgi:hypothetical protein
MPPSAHRSSVFPHAPDHRLVPGLGKALQALAPKPAPAITAFPQKKKFKNEAQSGNFYSTFSGDTTKARRKF